MPHSYPSRHGVKVDVMQLSEFATKIGGKLSAGHDPQVRAIICSSAECSPGALFFALRGNLRDGHEFVDSAFDAGAVACVVEDSAALAERPGIIVADTRKAWSRAAALWVGQPAQSLKTVLVTGTNGKTTTNWLLYNLCEKLGDRALRIGTLGAYAHGVIEDLETLTTPDANFIHATLAKSLAAGVRVAILEASSHALAQSRLDDLLPNVSIFTNLTRDHLDYHQDFESYFHAKLRVFDLLKNSGKKEVGAVVHLDAPYGDKAAAYARSRGLAVLGVGVHRDAKVRIVTRNQTFRGSEIEFEIEGSRHMVRTPLIGEYNADNIAGVIGAAILLGYPLKLVIAALADLPAVPGRLEKVPAQDLGVFVDYAHTPDALQNVLRALRPITERKLWVLFGCGGDRDRGKRPLMAEVAAQLADHVVVTSDNPRTEDPQQIVKDILESGISPYRVEIDRRKAIAQTVSELCPGDVLCIAGKGHEKYQIVGRSKIHFSDTEEAAAALKNMRGVDGACRNA